MPTVLHIDSSPRAERSHSRQISSELVVAIQAAHPDTTVIYRDLGHAPVPAVTEAWIAGAFSPPDAHTPEMNAALALSDELIAELQTADILVFGVPMYNFNVPSTFKAYIDNIARAEVTFTFGSNGPEGLLTGKKAFFVYRSRRRGLRAGRSDGGNQLPRPVFENLFWLYRHYRHDVYSSE